MVYATTEMVEKKDSKVDERVELLVNNVAAEMTTFHYCTILRGNLIGPRKEIADTARIEDRNHFEALIQRIRELGGKLPEYMKGFLHMASCPPSRQPKVRTDVQSLLTVLMNAKRGAVCGYANICNLLDGKDNRTYNLAREILCEEIEHESWLSEFPGVKPFCHVTRYGEISPFMDKREWGPGSCPASTPCGIGYSNSWKE